MGTLEFSTSSRKTTLETLSMTHFWLHSHRFSNFALGTEASMGQFQLTPKQIWFWRIILGIIASYCIIHYESGAWIKTLWQSSRMESLLVIIESLRAVACRSRPPTAAVGCLFCWRKWYWTNRVVAKHQAPPPITSPVSSKKPQAAGKADLDVCFQKGEEFADKEFTCCS